MLSSLPPLVILVMHVHSVSSAQNLALFKTAFQSSVMQGGIASRAVDGSREGKFGLKSCTHTKGSNNPWWAVDLEFQYKLSSVLVANRGDCCASRFSNVIIGTTDVSPLVTVPTSSNIRVCHNQQDALGLGEARSFKCEETGRYVVILRPKDRGFLTLCEVEVYGEAVGEAVEGDPKFVKVSIPQPQITANILDPVKVTCSYAMASDTRYQIAWFIEDNNQQRKLIYHYGEDIFDIYQGPSYLRVSRDNDSLIVQETIDTISERRFCCKVTIDTNKLHDEGCITVNYIFFPVNALQCKDVNTGKVLNNDAIYLDGPESSQKLRARVRCSYTKVNPACNIYASYVNKAGREALLASVSRAEAIRSDMSDDRGTSVQYENSLEFELSFEDEITVTVFAQGEDIERKVVFSYFRKDTPIDGPDSPNDGPDSPDDGPGSPNDGPDSPNDGPDSPNDVVIDVRLPDPKITAYNGDKVKLPFEFSLSSAVPWIVEWYITLPYATSRTPLYMYSPGVFDEDVSQGLVRVSRDNVSLIAQETDGTITVRRFCCRVSLSRLIYQEGCIKVTYIIRRAAPKYQRDPDVNKPKEYEIDASSDVNAKNGTMDDNISLNQKNGSPASNTYLALGITGGVIAVFGIVAAVTIFIDRKKKSEEDTNEEGGDE